MTLLDDLNISTHAVTPDTVCGLGPDKGAYVLIITMDQRVSIKLPKRESIILRAGTYFYVGSANGPGGIKARLTRHFKKQKKIHWHVDQLTTQATNVEAIAVPSGNECKLGEMLIGSGHYQPAIHGFGSSDCHMCDSHLFMPM